MLAGAPRRHQEARARIGDFDREPLAECVAGHAHRLLARQSFPDIDDAGDLGISGGLHEGRRRLVARRCAPRKEEDWDEEPHWRGDWLTRLHDATDCPLKTVSLLTSTAMPCSPGRALHAKLDVMVERPLKLAASFAKS